MLRRHRRLFAPLAALLLALPMLLGLADPDSAAMTEAELLHAAAPPPAMPRSLAAVPETLRATNAWLTDHFGLHRVLVHAKAFLSGIVLRSGNDRVLIGRAGWFYFLGIDSTMAQSAGLLVRPSLVRAAADMLATMQRVLAASGAHLVVAFPPNPATIYPEHLPDWARNAGRPTEYDLAMALLAQRGVRVVDLRPVLRAAKAGGKVYFMHDSHWTPRGALAAFNAVAAAAGRPAWRISPADGLGPPATLAGGDMARLLGIAGDVNETVEPSTAPVLTYRQLTDDPYAANELTSNRNGPTVLVIGDSYTKWFFKDLVMRRTGHFIWIHHLDCGFDWKWVERFHPQLVWYMASERLLICYPGQHPAGLDTAVAALGLPG